MCKKVEVKYKLILAQKILKSIHSFITEYMFHDSFKTHEQKITKLFGTNVD